MIGGMSDRCRRPLALGAAAFAAALLLTFAAARGGTRSDYVAAELAFDQRTLAGDYRRVGRHDPKWDAAAEEMLDGAARYFAGAGEDVWYEIDSPDAATLLAQCRHLTEELGCDDPMVVYCGVAFAVDAAGGDAGRRREAGARAARAYAGLRDSRYSAYRKMAAAGRAIQFALADAGPAGPHTPEMDQVDRDAQALEVECFTGDSFLPTEGRVLLELVWKRRANWKAGANQPFADAVLKTERHQWAALVVAGDVAVKAAWEARGTGVADSVTPQGWKGFGEALTKAADLYGRAYALHPEWPEAAAGLITVAKGGYAPAGTDEGEWFSRAIRAQVDYEPAWRFYADSLLPRWGGSHERMLEVGRAALGTEAFDTDVPLRFRQQLKLIVRDLNSDWPALARLDEGVWPDLKRMYDGMIAPLAKRDLWNANAFAAGRLADAYALGEWDAAAALLLPGGEGPGIDSAAHRSRNFADVGATPAAALAEIAARTGPQKTAVARAESLEAVGLGETAQAAWREVVEALPPGDAGRAFAEARLRERTFLKALRAAPAGQWVDVPADLNHWEAVEGDWRFDKAGNLRGRVTPARASADPKRGRRPAAPLVVFQPRLPADYQVRLTIGPASAADGSPGAILAGVVPGWGALGDAGVFANRAADRLHMFNGFGWDWNGPLSRFSAGDAEPVLRVDVPADGTGVLWVDANTVQPQFYGASNPVPGGPRRLAVATSGGRLGDECAVHSIQIRLEPNVR